MGFVDRVQHLNERPLQDLVLKRSDTKRPKPPVRLRAEHSPRQLRPVAPSMNPDIRIAKVRFEILPVVHHVTPSTPAAALGFNAQYAARITSTST